MLKQRVIDLTPPSSKELNEFRRFMGMNRLFEETLEPKEVDLSKDQEDPEDQIDPDSKERDKVEASRKVVVDIQNGKKVYDGERRKESNKKK